MAKTVGIGIQNFDKIRENQYFYIDKTSFIKEWWESGDDVTLITRPRRFGKTLNMSMVEEFFSIDYAKRGDLFRRKRDRYIDSVESMYLSLLLLWLCLSPLKIMIEFVIIGMQF